jgi:hypothetical protein
MQAHHLDNDYYDGSRMLPAWQVSSSSDALSAMLYPCARRFARQLFARHKYGIKVTGSGRWEDL